jgi:hypothetical protein
MTNDSLQLLYQIEELAAQYAAERIAGDPAQANRSELACEEYDAECDPTRLVERIMGVLNRVHDDDSACENPLMNVIEAVAYHATNGAAKTMGITTG